MLCIEGCVVEWEGGIRLGMMVTKVCDIGYNCWFESLKLHSHCTHGYGNAHNMCIECVGR